MNGNTNKLILLVSSLLLIALLTVACGGEHQFNGTAYDPPIAAPAISGTNWDGRAFQLSDLKGKVTLIFFGFTYCPDVCPLTLAELAQMVDGMGNQAQEVAVVFVSTDPERDTPERLAQYVPAFDPDFYGIHIPQADLDTVKKGYGVYAEKVVEQGQTDTEQYFVEHSGYIYVIDRDGNLREVFGYSEPKEKLLADLEYLLSS